PSVSSPRFSSFIVRPRHAAKRRTREHQPIRSLAEERGYRRAYVYSDIVFSLRQPDLLLSD
ncbi:MAG: hypothetical protein WBW93_04890, partial [Steroidobacteraceae bacterium]